MTTTPPSETPPSEFDDLQSVMAQGGTSAVLDRLADLLRQHKKYHELFEALKMKVRHQIGLPVLYRETGDDLDESLRTRLEEGLLGACRDVGALLWKDGKIREGWMYLRPVGDRAAAARALSEIEPNDTNLDEFVEVCLHEGVDASRGFRLVLQHYGTCNAITTFESAMRQRTPGEQLDAAGLLVKHIHHELLASVVADITRQQGKSPQETTLRELVADRDWLFGDYSYHLDTTHLASTVRFARLLDDPALLRLALDLTEYGRRLSKQFQYQGDEPFGDIYPSHALYFQALLGENQPAALEYFRAQAEASNPQEHGRAAVEVYIDLLARLGRYDEAIESTIRFTPPGTFPVGFAPSLLELSGKAGKYAGLMAYCRSRDDLLGFATGLVHSGWR